MKRLIFIAVLAGLAACDAPGPDFAGHQAARVTVEGSTFSVRRAGDEAQAIRLNMERRRGVMARAVRAIEIGTGCEIRPGSVTGDPAVIYARLTCAPVSTGRKK